MTAMPQMVAAFNGVGGAAAALVAVSEFYRVEALGSGQETLVSAIAVLLSVVIGTISFAGSIIAFVKLQELALGGSVTFPLQQVVNALIAFSIFVLSANIVAGGASASSPPSSRSTSSSARRYFSASCSSYPSAGRTCPS